MKQSDTFAHCVNRDVCKAACFLTLSSDMLFFRLLDNKTQNRSNRQNNPSG